MLIPFWFGSIHIGSRSSGIGDHEYDAAITLCWGWRGDVPPGEFRWHNIRRVSWNWLPTRIYRQIGAYLPYISPAAADAKRLRDIISPKRPSSANAETSLRSEKLLPSEYRRAIDSSRWTGRKRRLIGFGSWRHELWTYRSTRRSKMYVYLTGAKERTNEHTVYIAPAAITAAGDCPADWKDLEGHPKQFAVKFINGRASVEKELGEWMIKNGQAQRTSIIRQPGKALLGSLASALRGA